MGARRRGRITAGDNVIEVRGVELQRTALSWDHSREPFAPSLAVLFRPGVARIAVTKNKFGACEPRLAEKSGERTTRPCSPQLPAIRPCVALSPGAPARDQTRVPIAFWSLAVTALRRKCLRFYGGSRPRSCRAWSERLFETWHASSLSAMPRTCSAMPSRRRGSRYHAAGLEAGPRTWQGASRPHRKQNRQARRTAVAKEGSTGLRGCRCETRSGVTFSARDQGRPLQLSRAPRNGDIVGPCTRSSQTSFGSATCTSVTSLELQVSTSYGTPERRLDRPILGRGAFSIVSRITHSGTAGASRTRSMDTSR